MDHEIAKKVTAMFDNRRFNRSRSSLFTAFATSVIALIVFMIVIFSNLSVRDDFSEVMTIEIKTVVPYLPLKSEKESNNNPIKQQITLNNNTSTNNTNNLQILEVFGGKGVSENFQQRAKEFLRDDCEVNFMMTWISPAEMFGKREILSIESVFKSHPRGCLMILSSTMDSPQGFEILKPFLDRGYKVISITPDLPFLLKNTAGESWLEEIQTDMIVLKSFKGLRNVIGAQTLEPVSRKWTRLNNAVLVFDKNHPLLLKCIEEFALTFNGNVWGHNGPYLVSRVARAVEGTDGYNFTVMTPPAFYPVNWVEIEKLFKVPRTEKDLKRVKVKVLEMQKRSYGLNRSVMVSVDGDSVKLNVGGEVFETTASTIQSTCPDSLLAALSNPTSHGSIPVFIDRDPEIFSVILNLLRTKTLPANSSGSFSKQELLDEALYYGVESLLRSAMLPPPLLGFDASLISTITPATDGVPSAFTATAGDASLWIAHGGQISVYDWSLSHTGTVRTHLNDITSICRVWAESAAIGSGSASGLHFYDLSGGRYVGSTHWTDPEDPRIHKARVAAVTDSSNGVFASFECMHRENSVLQIDKSTLQVAAVIGQQPGSSAKTTVPEKLRWLPTNGVLVGSAVQRGVFGCSGYIRIWDPRSRGIVWETSEPGSGRSSRFGDSLADMDVDVEDLTIFKVCSKSGDLGMADIRKLGEDPWVYMSDENPGAWKSEDGGYSVVHCYRKQVLAARGGGLEVWSSVKEKTSDDPNSSYRRNFVDKEEDSERGMISKIEAGGDRLYVSREFMEGVEVWESSNFSGIVSFE
ncbi:hypothetical protein AALP_AA3G094800 [Arabis alpina]|uniref:BTB domain-containing protein n=1 Tax=Arabis alpina TaxID=50452 RepID=A0A087H836_ARAAL|nr:hypothetical protein AALP_AA3G094800 [Arabis alpina]